MKSYMAQWIAAMSANVAMLSCGMLFGWASPTLPKLLSGEDQLRLNSDEGAWAISMLSFGCAVGPLLSCLLVDRIGRKWSLLWMTVPNLASWLIIGLADSAGLLYAGRFVGGIAVGGTYSLMPMYLGEVAEDRIRGGLGTLMLSMLNSGMLFAFSVGPWVSRQTLCVIAVIPPLIFLLTFLWMPETPYYLIMKNNEDKAEKSLIWLRQNSNVTEELDEIRINVERQSQNDSSVFELIKSVGNRKALYISGGLLFVQQFCGVNPLQSYIFPTNVKAKASVILSMYGSALAMIISKLYQIISDAVGEHVVFYGFAIITMLGVVFIYFYVPETKQQSLQEIQDALNQVDSKDKKQQKDTSG
ncbi:facilitated trehalose transporter Tret1-like isoform X2 [Prorops nasuta]|uniref:facilitated trehalose transporter Tret1-like isoform X2 n=1 Tax=Prorops nasuta TaxID=863751 RepID=UPI0034CE8983